MHKINVKYKRMCKTFFSISYFPFFLVKMSGLFLLDICVEPTANPSAVLQDVHRAVKKGLETAKGKIEYVFKVG